MVGEKNETRSRETKMKTKKGKKECDIPMHFGLKPSFIEGDKIQYFRRKGFP